MTNYAAERLRAAFGGTGAEGWLGEAFDAALAAERRATVERIRAATHADPRPLAECLDAILDAEADR